MNYEMADAEDIAKEEELLNMVFTDLELRQIVNIKESAWNLVLEKKFTKDDLLKYIKQEYGIIKIARERHAAKGLSKNILVDLVMGVKKRIDKMFQYAIYEFSDDLALWVMYLKFCHNNESSRYIQGYSTRDDEIAYVSFSCQTAGFITASQVLDQLLVTHGDSKPEVFRIAALWEQEANKNCLRALIYIQEGLLVHRDNRLLLKTYFKIELDDVALKRKKCTDNNMLINPLNDVYSAAEAQRVYSCSIKHLKDLELLNDILEICEEYDFASDLTAEILNDITEYKHSERMWDILAKRILRGDPENEDDAKDKIKTCVGFYKLGLKTLNNSTLWKYYLDTLIMIAKGTKVLTEYKRKMLLTAFKSASACKMLSYDYYVKWVNTIDPSNTKHIIEVSREALVQYPDSVLLWDKMIHCYMCQEQFVVAFHVFELAVETLGQASVPVWKNMITYSLASGSRTVEEVFKRSLDQTSHVIGNVVWPQYLEWLAITKGFNVARKMYKKMLTLPPKCINVHKTMLEMESDLPGPNVKKIRHVHEMTCKQFGDSDPDVWIDYINFEVLYGKKERVEPILIRAKKALSPVELLDAFSYKYRAYGPASPSAN